VEQGDGSSLFSSGRPENVIRIRGGKSLVATNAPEIPEDGEGPERAVTLSDFALETEAVTARRFAGFIEATGYVTEAERFGWSTVFSGDLYHLEAAHAKIAMVASSGRCQLVPAGRAGKLCG
jgi:formylglycine-generating enzyme